jgi:methionyl-tRNA formyltransferase
MTANTGVIGATLHEVDAGLDTGRILLQVRSSINANTSLAIAERISFAQKVLLTLHWEQQERYPTTHTLLPEVNAAFDRFRVALGLSTQIHIVSSP